LQMKEELADLLRIDVNELLNPTHIPIIIAMDRIGKCNFC